MDTNTNTNPETTIPSAEAQAEHVETLTRMLAPTGIPLLAPPVDFRTDPWKWIAERIDANAGEVMAEEVDATLEALSPLLAQYASDESATERDAGPLAVLLRMVAGRIRYRIGEDSRFVRFGPLVLPTVPAALTVLRTLRRVARQRLQGNAITDVPCDGTMLRALLDSIKGATRTPAGALLQGSYNRTNRSDEGIRFGFDFHGRAFANLPKGENLPPRLFSVDPVGFKVADPCELQIECDMCDDGTADFLDRFGIGYEREGETYECDSCGAEHENDDAGAIELIDEFTLDAAMVRAIERQGFGDRLREYINAGGEHAETLAELLEADKEETRERFKPDAEHGIRFDADVWCFAPAFDAVEGADDIEGSQALEAGALLSTIVTEHTSAGVLPPVPGSLHYAPMPYERGRIEERRGISFVWDPTEGTLDHELGGGMRLRWHVRGEGLSICHPMRENGREAWHTLREHGSEWILKLDAGEGGEEVAALLGILKGSADI